MSNSRLIARFQGGIGNQLFEYAAARRLASHTGAELILDTTTGFERDFKYGWTFSLGPFPIKGRQALNAELLKPARSIQKGFIQFLDRSRPFEKRSYIKQKFGGFDPRIINLLPVQNRWFDGIWNSERYFSDMRDMVFNDLQLDPLSLQFDLSLGDSLKGKNSVAIHFRFFSKDNDYSQNIQENYYSFAIQYVRSQIVDSEFFVFSDNIERARTIIGSFNLGAHFIDMRNHKYSALQDLWLMSNCRHIIAANSTFSWWGAWLGEYGQKSRLTIVPDPKVFNQPHWILPDLLPERWIKIGT